MPPAQHLVSSKSGRESEKSLGRSIETIRGEQFDPLHLRADGVDVDAVVERKLYIPLDVSGLLSTVTDTSTDQDRFAKGVPHAIVEALRTAKERHLHLEVG